MNNLLLEVRVEEMPVSYIQPAVSALSTALSKKLSTNRIVHGDVKSFSTPRRLAVLVKNVEQRQKSITKRVYGPPESIAFNAVGEYDIPSIKFADRVGATLKELEIVSTDKGNYISVCKTELGLKTKDLLKKILPELILLVPFPKKMLWSNPSVSFARPIRSIIALLGTDIINFSLGSDIESGRDSVGHSFMSSGKISLSNPDNYPDLMKRFNVIVDVEERRFIISEGINKIAKSIGGKILVDNALLDTVNNLVEFPVAVVGEFDPSFLDLPKEILITVMREHQKYFAVVDDTGSLLPAFVAISNTLSQNMELIANGYERVLKARLSDARFFYDFDFSDSMEIWVEKLKGVLFHASLGSMHCKIVRLQEIISYLVDEISNNCDYEAIRSAYLCKADLVSRVVIEFPKLQGVMGSIYARLAGESDKVSSAIREHYKPTRSGGKLPKTRNGALLSITDKIDSICGCFLVGLEPTGTADPYALRRQGIGLLRIIRDMCFEIKIDKLVEKVLQQYPSEVINNQNKIAKKICGFLRQRLFHLLIEDGNSSDIVEAVISVSSNDIMNVGKRVVALKSFKKTDKLATICGTFKRIDNILRKSNFSYFDKFSEELFLEDSEIQLFRFYFNYKKKVELYLNNEEVIKALEVIVLLSEPIDLFFDKVRVVVKDKKLSYNRFAFLKAISILFYKIADFSKIIV